MIFTNNGCGACHTFTPIPAATGKVGPDLDDLSVNAKAAGQDLVTFIKQSIVVDTELLDEVYLENEKSLQHMVGK